MEKLEGTNENGRCQRGREKRRNGEEDAGLEKAEQLQRRLFELVTWIKDFHQVLAELSLVLVLMGRSRARTQQMPLTKLVHRVPPAEELRSCPRKDPLYHHFSPQFCGLQRLLAMYYNQFLPSLHRTSPHFVSFALYVLVSSPGSAPCLFVFSSRIYR